MDIVVLDTNVLLVDPEALLAFPDREIVLCDVTLGELDKIKIARTDPETRYRAREASRRLFELSDGKQLVDGIDLENGGRLRIVPFDTETPLPQGFTSKNPDDRVIVTAHRLMGSQQQEDGDGKVTLITNDLNMLLKAQTLQIGTERHDEGHSDRFVQRYIVTPLRKYKTPVTILAISMVLLIATVFVAIYTTRSANEASLPSEYRNFLSSDQADGVDALIKLQSDPGDPDALLTVANLYYATYNDAAADSSDYAESLAKKGIQYYTRYISVVPDDALAKTNLATLEFYIGDMTAATTHLQEVLDADNDNVEANYMMGLVAMQGTHDKDIATQCFQHVVELTMDDEAYADMRSSAQSYLDQLATEQETLDNPSSGGVAL